MQKALMIFSEKGNEPNIYDQQERDESQEMEITVETRAEAVERIKETFKKRLEERFGRAGEEPMDYHVPEHSEMVANDARAFLEIIRNIDHDLVSEEDLDLAYLEGWAHDLIQDSIKERGKPRRRHRGFTPQDIPPDLREKGVMKGNERASADELLEELKKYNYMNGESVFKTGPEEISADVGVTYPEFDFSAKLPDGSSGLKVYQPYLTPESSLRGLALATADLRGEARISKDLVKFRENGNAEFRELNFTIGEEVKEGIEKIPQERRKEIAKAIAGWIRTQVSFLKWQKELFSESIAANETLKQSTKREEILEVLKQEFSHFDKNIHMAEERSKETERRIYGDLQDPQKRDERLGALSENDFKDLLREVGYTLA